MKGKRYTTEDKDHGAAQAGRLGGGQTPGAATPTVGGPEGAAHETPGGPPGPLDGSADESNASRACLDLGLHRGRDDAWRSPADADSVGRAHAGVPRVESGPCAQVRRRDLTGENGHRAARCSGVHPVGQWFGVYRQGPPEVAGRGEDQDDLHRAGQSLAERLRRVVPRALPGRMPQPGATLDSHGGQGRHRGLPHPIQHPAAPQ
jgi:hypothetical protein